MNQITGYLVTFHRGRKAGQKYLIGVIGGDVAKARRRASRCCDRADNEYGAICCSAQPVFATAA